MLFPAGAAFSYLSLLLYFIYYFLSAHGVRTAESDTGVHNAESRARILGRAWAPSNPDNIPYGTTFLHISMFRNLYVAPGFAITLRRAFCKTLPYAPRFAITLMFGETA